MNQVEQIEFWKDINQSLIKWGSGQRCQWRVDKARAALAVVAGNISKEAPAAIVRGTISEQFKISGLKNTPETGLDHEGKPYGWYQLKQEQSVAEYSTTKKDSWEHLREIAARRNGTQPGVSSGTRHTSKESKPTFEVEKQPVVEPEVESPDRVWVTVLSSSTSSTSGETPTFTPTVEFLDSQAAVAAAQKIIKDVQTDRSGRLADDEIEAESRRKASEIIAARKGKASENPVTLRRRLMLEGLKKGSAALALAVVGFINVGIHSPDSDGSYISDAQAASWIDARESSISIESEDVEVAVLSPAARSHWKSVLSRIDRATFEASIEPPTAVDLLRAAIKPKAVELVPVIRGLDLTQPNTRVLGESEKPQTAEDLVRLAKTNRVLQAALRKLDQNPDTLKAEDIKCTTNYPETRKCVMDLFSLTADEADQLLNNTQQFAVENGHLVRVPVRYVDGPSSYRRAQGGENLVSNSSIHFVIVTPEGRLIIISQDCLNPLVTGKVSEEVSASPTPTSSPTATSTSTAASTVFAPTARPAGVDTPVPRFTPIAIGAPGPTVEAPAAPARYDAPPHLRHEFLRFFPERIPSEHRFQIVLYKTADLNGNGIPNEPMDCQRFFSFQIFANGVFQGEIQGNCGFNAFGSYSLGTRYTIFERLSPEFETFADVEGVVGARFARFLNRARPIIPTPFAVASLSPVPSGTPTLARTPTIGPSPIGTPTREAVSATPTSTLRPGETPTATTSTATSTVTPSPLEATATVTGTPRPEVTPSATTTSTATETVGVTPTATATSPRATSTETSTPTATRTPLPTPSVPVQQPTGSVPTATRGLEVTSIPTATRGSEVTSTATRTPLPTPSVPVQQPTGSVPTATRGVLATPTIPGGR